MIYEYAIEPELVVAWGKDRTAYRNFCKQFGLGTPRMMSEFPKLKNWRKQFRQAAATADETNELPRITALFNLMKESLVRRDGYDYDGTISWLENAEKENIRHKFQAILAQDNPRFHNLVLKNEDLEENALWETDNQILCRRISTDMAQLLRPILTNCSEIHFIDPHFGPENARFRRPLEAFLKIINEARPYRPEIKNIVVHTASQSDFKFFKQTCEEQLCKRIPAGISITLFRWKQRENGEKLHNRYILTDIGGIKVDPGLDDGNQGESFEVLLLGRKLYLKHWADYVSNPAFDKSDDPFEIIGKALN